MKIKTLTLICAFSLASACQSIPQKASPTNALKALKLEQVRWDSLSKKISEDENVFQNNGWIQNLNDPRLEAYISTALNNNFSLQASADQLAATLKNARISAARQWPSLDFNVRKNKVESIIPNADGSISTDSDNTRYSSNFNGSFNISWEIDVWQRLSAQKKANAKKAQVSVQDFEAARLSLAANVARAWFNLNSQKLNIDIAEKRLKSIKTTLEIVEEEYKSGSQSALNVYLNRADYSNQQANIADLKNSLNSSIRDFKVLLGEYPNIDLNFEASLPSLTKDIPAGMPAELVTRRPDVMASLYQWQSASYDAAVAHRARFPAFSLTASRGTSSDELSTLSEKTLLWNIINNISLPLFKGGQLKAQADSAKFAKEASFKRYLSTLLRSFNEVETALASEQTIKERLSLVNYSVSMSESGYELALDQYRAGIITYSNLLQAQRRWFDSQTQHVLLKNNALQNRISLNLALGGDLQEKEINGDTAETNKEESNPSTQNESE